MPTVLSETDTLYLSGRKPLLSSTTKEKINKNTIPDILRSVSGKHETNVAEINILLMEYLGLQSILERTREFSTNVNNLIVVNRAQEIIRKSVSYFLGEPISYTAKNDNVENMDILNMYMNEESKSAKDFEVGNWSAIAGTAYRLVVTNPDADVEISPFKIPTCDPRKTYVIYSSEVLGRPLLAGIYSDRYDSLGNVEGYDHWIYDGTNEYTFTSLGTAALAGVMTFTGERPHLLGEVPIVEYANNQFRIGDFEPVLGLLDALNKSISDRLNAIEQTVGAILVFVDCEIDETGGMAGVKQRGTIQVKSNGNNNVDIKYVSPELSQEDAQITESAINEYIDLVTGIPSRKEKSGGGDTGEAVFMRDGFQDLELVARAKERPFKEAERKVIRLVSKIMATFGSAILPQEIEVSCVRNRVTNIASKAQAAINLTKAGILDPEDTIKLLGITDQPKEMADRGKAYREADMARREKEREQSDSANENSNEPSGADE